MLQLFLSLVMNHRKEESPLKVNIYFTSSRLLNVFGQIATSWEIKLRTNYVILPHICP